MICRRLAVTLVLLDVLFPSRTVSSAFSVYTSASKSSQRFGGNHCYNPRHQRQDHHSPVPFLSAVPHDDDDNDSFSLGDTPLHDAWRSCQSFVSAAVVACVLSFSSLPSTTPGDHVFSPPPANAQVLQASIPPFGYPPGMTKDDFAQEKSTPVLEAKEEPTFMEPVKPVKGEINALEETWTLIDKYFLDRTFNGQDWKKVHEKYTAKNGNRNDDKTMKLVTEMVKSLGDKYSRVLDANQYAGIQKFDLIGVGVTLMPNENKEIIVGAPPVSGSASDQAGLKSGDFVIAINGLSTKGRTAFDIIDQVSENPNAESITFTVRTQTPDDISGEGYTRDVTMRRTFQKAKNPVFYKISEKRSDGTVVGYIRIFEFNSLVKGSLEEAIQDLEKAGANAFVLDLRNNPGGAFQSAVEISSLFFEDRVATNVVDSNLVELPFKTSVGRVMVAPEEPIAIWTDGGSASASEVFAGSLHDNCRAVVMGDRSFGKGIIQAVYGLKNGAGLVLTVAKYVTPNGSEIQGLGITPDIPGSVAPNIPGLMTDTSMVDFTDISRRLDPAVCKAPP